MRNDSTTYIRVPANRTCFADVCAFSFSCPGSLCFLLLTFFFIVVLSVFCKEAPSPQLPDLSFYHYFHLDTFRLVFTGSASLLHFALFFEHREAKIFYPIRDHCGHVDNLLEATTTRKWVYITKCLYFRLFLSFGTVAPESAHSQAQSKLYNFDYLHDNSLTQNRKCPG